MSTTFLAEIKGVNVRKTASGDREIVLRLVTEDMTALQAAEIAPDKLALITVTPQE